MSSYFLKFFYALLVLLLHTAGSILGFNWETKSEEVKCIKRERQALLKFKQGSQDDYGMLSTWRGDEYDGDCCKWTGIECSKKTGHVKMLNLRGSDARYLTGVINFTLLVELQNMEYLDLSWNDFSESQTIPELIGSFSNLRYLNLTYSHFGGKIPYQLGNLSHLKYLNLEGSYLEGAIPYQLENLSELEYLNLRGNYLDGAIPYLLGNLSHLKYLNLGGNYLDGAIPYQLGNLAQLHHFDLGGNSLFGEIPFQLGNLPMLQSLRLGGNLNLKTNNSEWLSDLSSLTNLDLTLQNLGSSHHWLQMIGKLLPNSRELRLSGCSLSDNDILFLFDSHSNISTSLTILDLSYNMLTSSTFQSVFNFSFNLKELYLSNNNFSLSFPPYLNYPSLVILDLSYNKLIPSIFQGNVNFSSKLHELYLRNCSLLDSNFLVPSASNMNFSSSLVILDLSFNELTSLTIFHWLFNFTTNLHELYLNDNLLEGPIPNDFGNIMNSLEHLDLSVNKLQGKIPAFFGNICTLRTLQLSLNNLSGEISSFIQNVSWCARHRLETLDLSSNRITSMLPDFSIFSSLRRLEISNNQLIREIPKSIGLIAELEYLYLDGNFLEGDITELHLSNLSKLKYLSLSDNSLSLKFGTIWVPPFQLRYLGLASCMLGPSFPSWLKTQSYLSYLDISDAEIIDYVPEWFWRISQYIGMMNISHNNLAGTIPNIPLKLTYRPSIFLNSNQFEGGLPSFLLQASMLNLSKNKISSLVSFLCGKRETANLATLDLSNNQIRGQLPDCWEPLKLLWFLDLSNNKLSGKIPVSMGTLVNLKALVLRNNSLMGYLPSSLKNCTNLIMLDVGENMLSGPIPSWMGESLQQLVSLSLRMNHFFGNLPLHLCYLTQIQLLDLSRNNLSHGIPTCLKNFTAVSANSINSTEILRHIYWHSRTYDGIYGAYSNTYELDISLMWKGAEYVFKNPELLLKSIDLSSNHLTGELPTEFGYLFGLVSLNLSRNNLSGEIPSTIGNLSSLDFLDLSRNHFSGRIPSSLSHIDRLARLDLSHNSLYGKIPLGRQLQTFDASSFEGNLNLCGRPLDKNCPEDKTPVQPQETKVLETDENSVFYEALYMSMGLGYFTGLWGLIGPILLWRPWRNAYLRFLNKLTDYVYVMVAVKVARCHRRLKG